MSVEQFTESQRRVLERHEVAAESRFVEAPVVGGRAHVLVVGERPGVLLINGIGTPGAMWAPLLAELDGLEFAAVDLPGFGLSDAAVDPTHDYRAGAVAFLEQVLDGLEIEAPVVISNSLGSLWASWLAIDRPDRVSGLVHIGCPAIVLDTSAPLPMRLLSVPALARVLMKLQPPSLRQVEQLSRMVGEFPLAPDIAELLLATERLPHFEVAFLATLNTLLRLRGSRPDMALTRDHLAQIRHPVQFVWGKADPFGSKQTAHHVRQAIPDAQLEFVEGGHAPWLSNAPEVATLVRRFLHSHANSERVREHQQDAVTRARRISAEPPPHPT